jgi:hypothetical protein
MTSNESVIAIYPTHLEAENGIKKLAQAGFDMKTLSLVGRGYHVDEHVIGFYNMADRIKFWGSRGAFWGGLWGLFAGGSFVTVAPIGGVVVLGYLAGAVIASIENAVVLGAVSALSAALYSIGIPENSIVEYEGALLADKFLITAHGSAVEMVHAKKILYSTSPVAMGHFLAPKKEPVSAIPHDHQIQAAS